MKEDTNDRQHVRNILLRSPLFAGMDGQVLDEMLQSMRCDSWRRGIQLDPAIFHERFYLLLEGRIEVMRINPETGRTITLALLGPGDGIDIISLLNDRPHDISPVAVDNVELVSVPLQTARDWIARYPAFNRNFLPYLGEQMRKMEDLATDLALHDTMTRLARLILRYVQRAEDRPDDGRFQLNLINDLRDETLARMVGSVRQVVNRHLQHWRREGVLRKDRFHTEVTELEALQDYADGMKEEVESRRRARGVC